MSAQVLERVRDYLELRNLLTGYSVRFFRFSDVDLNGRDPFILFRVSGDGAGSDPYVQSHSVEIWMVNTPENAVTLTQRATEIAKALREPFTSISGVIKIHVPGNPVGPVYFDNDRPAMTLGIRVETTDL